MSGTASRSTVIFGCHAWKEISSFLRTIYFWNFISFLFINICVSSNLLLNRTTYYTYVSLSAFFNDQRTVEIGFGATD